MEAVWPEAVEGEDIGTPGSTTPVKQESRKKKKEDDNGRKAKKMNISSGCWSQESEVEEEVEKRYSCLGRSSKDYKMMSREWLEVVDSNVLAQVEGL